MHDPQTPSPPPGAYTDAPPEEERSSTSYLILAVNFVILAGALVWVIHRSKEGTAQPGAHAEPRTGTALTTTMNPGAGIPDPVAPLNPFEDDPRAGRFPGAVPTADGTGGAQPGSVDRRSGRRTLAPRPRFDGATAEQFFALDRQISALGPGVEVIRAVRGQYPTSNRPEYGANRGVEALVEVLRERGTIDAASTPVRDTDGDGREELVDPWGRPLVYFSSDDYGTAQDVTGVGSVTARERWMDDPGSEKRTWQGEKRFQLFSVGPNGADDYGGYDDVTSWISR